MIRYRIYIPALMALMTAACTSTTDEPVAADGTAVSFTATADKSSRAITTADNLGAQSFAVWADYYPASSQPEAATTVFAGSEVSYKDGSWTYTDTRYWFPGMNYRFAAIHPAQAVAAEYNGGTCVAVDGFDVLAGKGVDLLGAYHVRECVAGQSQGAVAFAFRHLLSRLNFVATVNASVRTDVVIDNVILYGIPSGGSWSGFDIGGNSHWTADPGTATTAATPLGKAAAITVSASDTGGKELFDKDSNLLLCIPQQVPENALLEVSFHYADNESVTHTYRFNLSFASATLAGGWEPGRSYRYTFEIGAGDFILFSRPEVVAWEEQGGSNIIIQGNQTN